MSADYECSEQILPNLSSHSHKATVGAAEEFEQLITIFMLRRQHKNKLTWRLKAEGIVDLKRTAPNSTAHSYTSVEHHHIISVLYLKKKKMLFLCHWRPSSILTVCLMFCSISLSLITLYPALHTCPGLLQSWEKSSVFLDAGISLAAKTGFSNLSFWPKTRPSGRVQQWAHSLGFKWENMSNCSPTQFSCPFFLIYFFVDYFCDTWGGYTPRCCFLWFYWHVANN